MKPHERAAFVSAVQDVTGRVAGSVFDTMDYFPRLTEFGAMVGGLLGSLPEIARRAAVPSRR